MSIGISFALGRLRDSKIFCISPSKINICGQVNLIVFDKTGTLTQDGILVIYSPLIVSKIGLDVLGFRYIDDLNYNTPVFSDLQKYIDTGLMVKSHFAKNIILVMACCHTLKLVEQDLLGDPLDLKMFEFTQFTLKELHQYVNTPQGVVIKHSTHIYTPIDLGGTLFPDDIQSSEIGAEIKVVQVFEFLPSLKRVTCIVREVSLPVKSSRYFRNGDCEQHIVENDELDVYHCLVKGGPEVIAQLSTKRSCIVEFILLIMMGY